ncbi:MAG: hypothetical protein ACE5D4_06280 [Thermodesulfobacteriota bacterium]
MCAMSEDMRLASPAGAEGLSRLAHPRDMAVLSTVALNRNLTTEMANIIAKQKGVASEIPALCRT